MGTGAITSYVDVAQLVLYAFWIFFFSLCVWLVRENRREGYPLETWDGRSAEGWVPMPAPKTYLLADGREVEAPRERVSTQAFNAERLHGSDGTAIEPTGNPLLAGVGPGSWTERADVPLTDHHGEISIRPLSFFSEFGISDKDPDPRGMTVVDADDEPAGTVRDLWLDHGEMLFRYLELEVPAGGGVRRVLLPMTFARITSDKVKVHALLASQFADVPGTKAADSVTLLEEERITAYYGAGLLYARPERAEPLF